MWRSMFRRAPLRLYLTGRVSRQVGAPAQAKLMEPVFAFDREVTPPERSPSVK